MSKETAQLLGGLLVIMGTFGLAAVAFLYGDQIANCGAEIEIGVLVPFVAWCAIVILFLIGYCGCQLLRLKSDV